MRVMWERVGNRRSLGNSFVGSHFYQIWLRDAGRYMTLDDVVESEEYEGDPLGLRLWSNEAVEGDLLKYRELRLAAGLEVVPVTVHEWCAGIVIRQHRVEW